MKKIVICSLFFLLAHAAWASHIRGGYVTYKWIEGSTYEFSAIIFLDPSGIRLGNLIALSGLPASLEMPFVEEVTLPDAADPRNTVIRQTFSANYTFPAVPFLGIVTYRVGITLQNRNAGILNLATPSDQIPFFVESEIRISSLLGVNNSPVLTDDPEQIFAKNNATKIIEIQATDTDGDSLVYSIIPPMQQKGRNANGYVSPAAVPPCTSCSLNIVSDTGIITWDKPVRAGEYVLTVKVEEYRRIPNSNNFVRIGYITRDVQIIVSD